MRHTEEKMGRLIWKIKNQNELIRRFVEEEDAVGVVEIILILVDICTEYGYVYSIYAL